MMKKQIFIQSHPTTFYFQAFLIAVVSHMAMQLEFFAKNHPTEAHAMFSFIDMCRENLIQGENKLSWLKEAMAQGNIQYFITEIFIKKIAHEIKFCQSLESGLLFAKTYFRKNHPQVLGIFYDTTLRINIEFLKTLELFFSLPEFQIRFQVMEELFVNLVIQKGFMIAIQNNKSLENDSLRTNVSRLSFSMFSISDTHASIHTEHLRYNTK